MNDDLERQAEDEQQWPAYCEFCGDELKPVVTDVVMNSDSQHLQTGSPGTVFAQDVCENEKCPAKLGEATPAYDPFTGEKIAEPGGPGGA